MSNASRLLDLGTFFGPIMCIITAVQGMILLICEWFQPANEIDVVPKALEVERVRWVSDERGVGEQ
jgi:hypothetical protein